MKISLLYSFVVSQHNGSHTATPVGVLPNTPTQHTFTSQEMAFWNRSHDIPLILLLCTGNTSNYKPILETYLTTDGDSVYFECNYSLKGAHYS